MECKNTLVACAGEVATGVAKAILQVPEKVGGEGASLEDDNKGSGGPEADKRPEAGERPEAGKGAEEGMEGGMKDMKDVKGGADGMKDMKDM